MSWWSFKPYVSVAERRASAAREVAKLAKKGRTVSPVKLAGRKIAETFWGKAWCDHLESFSDFENRLPRGRTYVRNGSVVDLQIRPGTVTALVSGSSLYTVTINIKPLPAPTWKCICGDCSGQIGSLVELLQGRLSSAVMQIVTRRDTGLFPAPAEIEMDCSCPDWAGMCKHVAAVLYGVGARLDQQPELLFTLRKVDHLELVARAGDVAPLSQTSSSVKTLAAGDLEDVFGIQFDGATPTPPQPGASPVAPKTRARGTPKPASTPPPPPALNPRRSARGKSASPASDSAATPAAPSGRPKPPQKKRKPAKAARRGK